MLCSDNYFQKTRKAYRNIRFYIINGVKMGTSDEKAKYMDKYAEDKALLERALLESIVNKANCVIKDYEEQGRDSLSVEDKRKMNRFFRDVLGSSADLYSEN